MKTTTVTRTTIRLVLVTETVTVIETTGESVPPPPSLRPGIVRALPVGPAALRLVAGGAK
jgi:hypothetical protein